MHQYYTTPQEAGGTRSYEFARRIGDRGHSVHVITTTLQANGSYKRGWTTTRDRNVTVHRLRLSYDGHFSFRRRLIAFALFALAAAVKTWQVKPDLIFATSTPLTIAIPALFARCLRRAPMVFEVRDAWPDLPIALGVLKNPLLIWLARALEKETYRNSARVVALSPDMAASVAKCGYPTARIAVIPNACDNVDALSITQADHSWSNLPELSKRGVVIYMGALGKSHGTPWLADLAAQCLALESELCFVVVGEGADEQRLRGRAADLRVLNVNLFMHPPIKKQDVQPMLSRAIAGISTVIPNPAMNGNSANKFFDYLAAGLPIFINYGGWQQKVLEDAAAGARLSVSNIADAANELVRLLGDQEFVKRAGQASKRLATQKFSRDALAEQLIDLLERVDAEAHDDGRPRIQGKRRHNCARS